jgi:transposase-like protein
MGRAEAVARARELLAVDPSVRAAAAALGVSRSSLQRWLKEDDGVDQDVEDAVA